MHLTRGRWPLVVAFGALGVAVAALGARRLDSVVVRGRSMAPTLLPGDRLLVARIGRLPRVGEVVLAPDPRTPSRELVKRVASASRDAVELRGDNAAASTDARAFGTVPGGSVRWRAVLRYWPMRRAGRIRPAREVTDSRTPPPPRRRSPRPRPARARRPDPPRP